MAVSLRDKIQPGPALRSRGFALPTILIASVVMLMVLLVSVTSTTAIRTAMFNQYYSQLAQVAGEAGVEYAKACLNASANVPGWSDAKPLMPNTDCSGTVQSSTYPSYVMMNGNVRSGFSIGMPTLDSSSRAKTLPNSGYVEITRKSNVNSVWRRYNQPSVQAAVVPDLCSGTATSPLGWVNAVKFAAPDTFPDPTALKIGLSTGDHNPGPMYFRKDFSVTEAGGYGLQARADNLSDVYIDNNLVLNTNNLYTVFSANTSLSVGCHTILVKLTNTAILSSINPASLMVSLKANVSSQPLVVSDTTWRVSTGLQKHFSDVNYYADPLSWTVIRDLGLANSINAGWGAASDDSGARYVSTTHSYDGSGNYPAGFTLFRDNRIIKLSQSAVVKITMMCDGDCYPYMDGNLLNTGITTVPASFTITLTEGSHKLAFLASNVSGPAGYAFTAVDTATGALITHTDTNWSAANFWSATNPGSSTSYDNSYKPNPDPLPEASVAILAVGGGGGGGGGVANVVYLAGGGGGEVEYASSYSLALGSYFVNVGTGGTGNPTGNAGYGQNSSFGTIVALGGTGAILQGGGGDTGNLLYKGGIRNSLGAGGGAGSAASGQNAPSSNVGGAGGSGTSNSMTGGPLFYGGGGGGGAVLTNGIGGAGGGGSNTAGAASTGGGGGGGSGWAGGSGVVIIRYLTSSMTATGGTQTPLGLYTIRTFTTSGTFTVTSIQ